LELLHGKHFILFINRWFCGFRINFVFKILWFNLQRFWYSWSDFVFFVVKQKQGDQVSTSSEQTEICDYCECSAVYLFDGTHGEIKCCENCAKKLSD